jgi:hypothetical protein
MTFLIMLAGLVGLGFVAWILIRTFSVEHRDSKGEGQRPS